MFISLIYIDIEKILFLVMVVEGKILHHFGLGGMDTLLGNKS